MAPAPTGPSASRGPPPTGPKVRTAIPVALTGGAHASGSGSTTNARTGTVNGSGPVPVAFGSSYGYDASRARVLSGSQRGGRGRGFGRANGAFHGHGATGMSSQPYPGAYQASYANGFQQPAGYAGYTGYDYTGQYTDPSLVAGPSTTPYSSVPSGPSLASASAPPKHKATAPKPPSRPPTPPPPPPLEPDPDASISGKRSPVKIALPRITAKEKTKPVSRSPVKEQAGGRVNSSGPKRSERQPEFLPTDETSRSPISITFSASSKAVSRPAHLDLDNVSSDPLQSPLGSAVLQPDRPPTPPLADVPPTPPPPPPPDFAPDAPPTPPLDEPISPRVPISIPISPRLKRPPTSPRPALPRLQPPPPPIAEAAFSTPEVRRPPTSPKPRIQSLTRPTASTKDTSTSRAASKWDVGPAEANGEPSRKTAESSRPPANHFREMPSRAEAEDESDASEEDESDDEIENPSWSREMPPHRQVPPHLAQLPTQAPPPPPPRSPTPPPPLVVEPEPPLWSIPRQVGSYLITLSDDGRKEVSRRVDGLIDGRPIEVVDPRKQGNEGRGRAAAKVVTMYRQVTYPWGPLSVGTRPPEPATAVLITGLSPLTTADQVRTFLRPHGRIRELDAKMDPKSGMQLGICWVKFDGPAGSASGDRGRKSGGGISAHDVAVAVVKACNGHRVGMTSTERITVVLDGEGKKAIKAVKEEMERRYPKPRPKVEAAVPPPKPATPMAPPLSTAGGRGTPTSGAATPRVPSLGATPHPIAAKPLPVPVPIKLHAQYKAGLPRNPALSGPSTNIPSAYAAPRAVPLAAPPKISTHLPARPMGLPSRPPTQSFTSSFVEAPFEKHRRDRSRSRDRDRGERGRESIKDRTDTYLASRSSSYSRSPPPPRSRFRSPSTDYSTDSDSDSDYYRRGRFRNRGRSRSRSRSFSRSPRRDSYTKARASLPKDGGRADAHTSFSHVARREVKQRVEDDDKTKLALAKNGRPAVWIDKDVLGITQQNEVYLWDHFRNFRPENIIRAPTGFYVLFADHDSAERARILDGSVMHGTKVALVIKTGHVKARPAEVGQKALPMVTGKKGKVAPAKSTTVASPVAAKTASKVAKVTKVVKRRITYTSSEESEDDMPAKRAKVEVIDDKKQLVQDKVPTPVKDVPTVAEVEAEEGESEIEPDADVEPTTTKDAAKGKKRPAAKPVPAPAPTAKKAKKGKKARIVSPAPLITPLEVEEPPVAEIKLDEPVKISAPIVPAEVVAPVKSAAKVLKAKTARLKKSTLPPLERFIAEEQVVDEEDAYWLSRALAMPAGSTTDVEEDDTEMDPLLPEDHPLHHTSGAWRVEGLRKVPPALKSAYLPQRNRAQAAAEDASALSTGLTTGRTARASGRRLALDMETHRKTLVNGAANAARESAAAATTAENDIFAFNQLRIRKKQLRFARSAIEGYGLYAMETIQTGEMVCEYVGELVRSSVADLREAKYLKQGIGSSYLFRIDADVVCDATFRGSVSRLINHSCDPSASAKIISINGQSKIVIYAKRLLSPGEEILYDYKFPLESDPALRVPCLCGSKICRGFLN